MIYIGFDLGDGESCITLYDDTNPVRFPQPISIAGKNSFLSAVSTWKGNTLLGELALSTPEAKDAAVCFKRDFKENRPESVRALSTFVSGVMKELRSRIPDIDNSLKYHLTVGVPADWDENTVTRYRSLFAAAGLAEIDTVSESRAAFLCARNMNVLGEDSALLMDSALVIDFGSSTLDFAYVVDGRDDRVGVFGDPHLGGGFLDEMLLDDAISCLDDAGQARIRELFIRYPSEKARAMTEMRRVKENYFSDEERSSADGLVKPFRIYAEGVTTLFLTVSAQVLTRVLHRPQLILNARSFLDRLADNLNRAVELVRERPPKVVLLTGGASRMRFFADACREKLSCFDCKVLLSDEPAFDIARGLSYAGETDARMRQFCAEAARYTQSDRVEAHVRAHLPELTDVLSREIIETAVVPAVRDALAEWRSRRVKTLDEMNAGISSRIRAFYSSPSGPVSLSEAMRPWADKLMAAVQDDINAICNEYGVDASVMDIGGLAPEVKYAFERFSGTDELALTINVIVGVVLSIVLGMVCGGSGMVLVTQGPLGVIAGILIAAGLVVVGKEPANRLLLKMDIPTMFRRMLREEAILSSHSKEKMRNELSANLLSQKEFENSIVTGVSKVIDDTIEALAAEKRLGFTSHLISGGMKE